MLLQILISLSITVLVIVILFIVLGVLSAIIMGSRYEDDFMTNWHNCNGNCTSCRDKQECMNRPYEGE